MDVYEEMWKSLVQRLTMANTYSLRSDITYQHIISLMASYEEHYGDRIDSMSVVKEPEDAESEKLQENNGDD